MKSSLMPMKSSLMPMKSSLMSMKSSLMPMKSKQNLHAPYSMIGIILDLRISRKR